MRHPDPTSADFFEAKYKGSGDPWSFATDPYELSRYRTIFNALAPRTFRRAFEPGCSVGVLTEMLASICDRVEASDVSPTAIDWATERTEHLGNVQTTCAGLSAFIPDGTFDLIVFSEIGYYFNESELLDVVEALVSRIRTSGVFLAAHWLGKSQDHLLSGDCVHEVIARVPRLSLQHSARYPGFRLDLWIRV